MDCAFSSAKKDPEFSVGAGRSGRVMRTTRSKGAARWRHRPSWRSRAGGHHQVEAACALARAGCHRHVEAVRAVLVLTTRSRQRVPCWCSPPRRGSVCPCPCPCRWPSPRRGSASYAGAHHQVAAACAVRAVIATSRQCGPCPCSPPGRGGACHAGAHHHVEAVRALARAGCHRHVEAGRAVLVPRRVDAGGYRSASNSRTLRKKSEDTEYKPPNRPQSRAGIGFARTQSH